jgi:hypothetical protein
MTTVPVGLFNIMFVSFQYDTLRMCERCEVSNRRKVVYFYQRFQNTSR